MVEDIVVITDLDDAAVGIAKWVDRVFLRTAVEEDVTVGDEGSFVFEWAIWGVTDGVAELVSVDGGIAKIVFAVEFADGGGFEEFVAFEWGAIHLGLLAEDLSWAIDDGEHVITEFHGVAAIDFAAGREDLREGVDAAKASIEIGAAVIID